MSTIVTRAGKGSALTHAEADANFTNLNADKLEAADIGTTVQAYSSNLDSFASVTPTAAGLALLDDVDTSAQRTTLGLGTAATQASTSFATSGSVTTSGLTQNTSRVLGRTTASVGAVEELTVSQVLDLVGSAAQGDLLYRGASSWARLAAGTSGQFLQTLGAAANPTWASATSATLATPVASTSGTAISFTSIPAGVKQITLSFDGVSTNGTDNWIIQLGDSGGYESTGYLSASSAITTVVATSNYTNGFGIRNPDAVALLSGTISFTLVNSSTNIWAAQGTVIRSDSAVTYTVAGSKALSATLDRIQLTTTGGANTFDAGTVNILYV